METSEFRKLGPPRGAGQMRGCCLLLLGCSLLVLGRCLSTSISNTAVSVRADRGKALKRKEDLFDATVRPEPELREGDALLFVSVNGTIHNIDITSGQKLVWPPCCRCVPSFSPFVDRNVVWLCLSV